MHTCPVYYMHIPVLHYVSAYLSCANYFCSPVVDNMVTSGWSQGFFGGAEPILHLGLEREPHLLHGLAGLFCPVDAGQGGHRGGRRRLGSGGPRHLGVRLSKIWVVVLHCPNLAYRIILSRTTTPIIRCRCLWFPKHLSPTANVQTLPTRGFDWEIHHMLQ